MSDQFQAWDIHLDPVPEGGASFVSPIAIKAGGRWSPNKKTKAHEYS
jgi:hypothetical protein